MATLPDAIRADEDDVQPARSVLHLEMQSGERRLLSLFASSFLKWIKDEAASSFARDAGAPAIISFDESARDAETATLHLTLTWSRSETEALAARPLAVGPTPSHEPPALAPRETPGSFLFTYDSETPIFDQSPAGADVTMMMAAVLEQSERVRRSTPARHVAVWFPAALVAGAARGRDVLARWTEAAAGSAAGVLDRGRTRGHQVAAIWYSGSRVALAHSRSVVHLLRTRPSAIVTPMSWAAAALFVATAIYVQWPVDRPAAPSVAHGIAAAAATPPASQPAPVIAAQPQPSPAVVTAEARPSEAGPLPTSGVAKAAQVIPAASTSPSRTVNANPVNHVRQARGYVGSLLVTSEPQGADVSVDGVPQGRTPLAIGNLNIGSRVVRVELPGHQRWSWAVSVVANRRTPIAVRLLPMTPISGPSGAAW
jgi:hypothetical protein